MTRRVGEVVAAASTSFVAQCYQLYGAPPLGSSVRTGSPPGSTGSSAGLAPSPWTPTPPGAGPGESKQQALIFGHALPMPVVIHTREYASPESYTQLVQRTPEERLEREIAELF